jgi:hypothetical protein
MQDSQPPTPVRPSPWRRIARLVGLVVLVPALALAQAVTRPIPADAKRGYLSHVSETTLSLDGRPVKLAPGGFIRDASNLIIMPATLPRDSLVKYRTNAAGEIVSAWILTPEEAARPDPASKGAITTGSSYVEPPGTPIERVLGTPAPPSGYGPPPAKRQ